MTQSMDFKRNIKFTSNPHDNNPEYLIKQLRRNKINHIKYDHGLYRKTKTKLNDLLKTIDRPTKG
jgi:hypothetical protein